MKVLIKNEGAQAGVGTLIIFIAMVLVAAVAAAVLIQTSSVMQSKSTTTTKEASQAITENVIIESVFGTTNTTNLLNINMTVRIGPGSGDVNLSKVVVLVNGNQKNATITSLRDLNTTSNILTSGSLASLGVVVSDLSLVSKSAMIISLVPERGTTTNMPITLPTIAATTTNIALYP